MRSAVFMINLKKRFSYDFKLIVPEFHYRHLNFWCTDYRSEYGSLDYPWFILDLVILLLHLILSVN